MSVLKEKEVGTLLRYWRDVRRVSQLDLALEADTSTRHLSFVENGKSHPSRELLLRLAGALRLPYRHCNTLLIAAGYEPHFPAAAVGEEEMAMVNFAIRQLLAKHDPYPAVVIDPAYEMVDYNEGFARTVGLFAPQALDRYQNLLRLTFAEDGLRPFCEQFVQMQQALLARLFEEAVAGQNPAVWRLYQEMVPEEEARPRPFLEEALPRVPVLTFCLRDAHTALQFFSTITTFGTPLDVTAQELRIETMFPADEATRRTLVAMETGA